MADSNITKRALSSALKELMQEKPFQKISVADICERCCMNRQSFYYHFKDKYDLLIWIFDTDFLSLIRKQQEEKALDIVSQICRVMYKNRVFYRAAFAVQGQNSLTEHLREVAEPDSADAHAGGHARQGGVRLSYQFHDGRHSGRAAALDRRRQLHAAGGVYARAFFLRIDNGKPRPPRIHPVARRAVG